MPADVICAGGCGSWRVTPGDGLSWDGYYHVCSDCQRIQDADTRRYILHIDADLDDASDVPEELLVFPIRQPYGGYRKGKGNTGEPVYGLSYCKMVGKKL